MAIDTYYSRPEVSNSDLSNLKKMLYGGVDMDLTQIFAFGSLVDAMITEPSKLDFFNLTCGGYQHTADEFAYANEMKKAFYRDPFCFNMVKQCSFQKVSINPELKINHEGIDFVLPARAKWDLFCESFDMGGDIKSTACTTQKQCEDAVYHFDYDRSRAWYMDIESRTNDILIFISKINFKVFKIPVKKGSPIYNSGKAKYSELAFQYYTLF